jgi:hypothetical protein
MIFVPALAAALHDCGISARRRRRRDRTHPPGSNAEGTGPADRIENVGGAGGMIAAAKAARAKPDGYTILLHQDALAAGMTL